MRTVEEIKSDLFDAVGEERKGLIEMRYNELCGTLVDGIPLDRLEDICNAEKAGRCVVLPCKAALDFQVKDADVRLIAHAREDIPALLAEIESLQSQLSKLEKRIATEGFPDLETMISKYKTVMLAANELSIEQDEEIEMLKSKLYASQRRERAARNELCLKCGRYHDAHNGACDGCRWKGADDSYSVDWLQQPAETEGTE